MSKAILDTDIASELIKGANQKVVARKDEYLAVEKHYYLTTMTVMEIVKGLTKNQSETKLANFIKSLESIPILTLDLNTSILAGQILASLERAGRPIGNIDPVIAAIAIAHDFILISGNTKHYNNIVELGYPLKLQNWRE